MLGQKVQAEQFVKSYNWSRLGDDVKLTYTGFKGALIH